jgi:hypothetical protein
LRRTSPAALEGLLKVFCTTIGQITGMDTETLPFLAGLGPFLQQCGWSPATATSGMSYFMKVCARA